MKEIIDKVRRVSDADLAHATLGFLPLLMEDETDRAAVRAALVGLLETALGGGISLVLEC